MGSFDWSALEGPYVITGAVLGALSAVVSFFGVWFIGSKQFGVWAYILGWIPGLVLAIALFLLMLFAWPLPLVGFAYFWFRRR